MGEVVNVEEILHIDKRDLKIEEITKALRKEEQVDLGEQHLFIEGVYCRSGIMPKGSLIVGLRHKKEAINVMSSGKILIKTNMEDPWTEITAPFLNSTPAGMRKIIYVLEDATFMNIFRTDNTDLDDLYEELAYHEEGSKPHIQAEEIKIKKLKDLT